MADQTIANDLTEALRPPDAPDEPSPGSEAPWAITDDGGAEWAIRKLAAARAAIATIEEQFDHYVEAAGQWAASAKAKPSEEADYFKGLLSRYLIERNEADPKVKSIKLPSGEIASRKTGGGWKVVNESELVDHLMATHSELVDMRLHLNKAAANKALLVKGDLVVDPDGEIVPGVEVVPEGRIVAVHTEELA